MIDAICIDQDNQEEKKSQIRLMSKLYRWADTVWAWLGLHDQDAVTFLDDLVRVAPEIKQHEIFTDTTRLNHKGVGPSVYDLPIFSSDIWRKTHTLLISPWFSRLWVVQEAALARQLIFLSASTEIPVQKLCTATKCCGDMTKVVVDVKSKCWNDDHFLPLASGDYIFELCATMAQHSDSETSWSLVLLDALMLTALDYVCSYPYDHVRGLIGLVDEQHADELGALDDVPLGIFYARFTHRLLRDLSPPSIYWWWIFACATAPGKRGDLPSWVPDYSKLHRNCRGDYAWIGQHFIGFGENV